MGRSSIDVMVACNDYRNGMFQGFIDAIEVGGYDDDWRLNLEGYCRMSFGRGFVRIGRFKYRFWSHAEWVGNWCWDLLRMDPEEAARLLNNLRASGKWSPHEGTTLAWDRWKRDEPFIAADFDEQPAEVGA